MLFIRVLREKLESKNKGFGLLNLKLITDLQKQGRIKVCCFRLRKTLEY